MSFKNILVYLNEQVITRRDAQVNKPLYTHSEQSLEEYYELGFSLRN